MLGVHGQHTKKPFPQGSPGVIHVRLNRSLSSIDHNHVEYVQATAIALGVLNRYSTVLVEKP